MNYAQQITTTLDNDAETVSVLGHLPVSKLDSKLDLIRKQLATARKYEQHDAVELLKIWQDQVLNAKELKQYLKLEDNNVLDVNMELSELAAFEMIEKRQDILKNKLMKESLTANGIK